MHEAMQIAGDARIGEALRQLEEAGTKTLLVVDDERVLLGTLSDGDVRRWILGGGHLDGQVAQACQREPFVVGAAHERAEVRRAMLERQIGCVPVVDEHGRVTDVLLWSDVFADRHATSTEAALDVPVVIMAGGAGTRLAPFTSVLPKPLIPIGGKTVLELIMETFTAYGVNEFLLSVHHKSRIIKSFLEELEPAFTVRYLYEDEPLGTAGALSALAGQVAGDLIVTNCDVIVRADYAALVRHHRRHDHHITLAASLRNFRIPYGICEVEDGLVREIREKPEFDFLVSTGLYVLKGEVLDLIPRGTHFHMTDLIAAVKERGGRVGAFPISDRAWIDTGEWAEYRSAVATLTADRRKEPR